MPVPEHYLELETVYAATLARGFRSLAVAAANRSEGVTSTVSALAHRNLYAGRSTLIVDFNLLSPAVYSSYGLPLLPPEPGRFPSPQLVEHRRSDAPLAVITPRPEKPALLQLREPGRIEAMIEEWKGNFDTVLFDTSAINVINGASLPGERVAAACDATLLVVLSGKTTATAVEQAKRKLTNAGATLVGGVLNDRDDPPLSTELLRETRRFERRFPRAARWLEDKIRSSALLNLEV
jgi:protein-tyrosine kinase